MRKRQQAASVFLALSRSGLAFAVTRLASAASFLLLSVGVAQAQIQVTEAQIGCLDLKENVGDLTSFVANACNGKMTCSYKAPTEDEYKKMGVKAHTRTFCTQGMEIEYKCAASGVQTMNIPGDAWNQPPAVLSCEAPPPPPQPLTQGARLMGLVDLHTHPLSNLGFGGKLIYGGVDVGALLPADPDCNHNVRARDAQQALGHDKSTHGGHDFISNTCGDELRKAIISNLQSSPYASVKEDADGAPDFTDWPLWNDVTHQKMWVDWIRRTYNAGLRVMVALAVNNKTLGDAVAGPGDYPTDDRSSADLQIAETKAFVGRHPDFMEVAYSAADLERIVRANKLAVVLGVETDNIGNLHGAPENDLISGEIDHLTSQGARYFFPIHLLDNAFGGTAAYKDLFNYSTYREEGHYWDLGCTPAANGDSQEAINFKFPFLDAGHLLLPPLLTLASPVKLGTVFPPTPIYPNCGLTNNRGLSAQGEHAIRELMRRGMLIDIDHMSDRSKNRTIEIALSMNRRGTIGYPLNSGHSGVRGFFTNEAGAQIGNGDISERSTSLLQYKQIAQLHGMAGVGSAGINANQWLAMYQQVLIAMGAGAIAGFGTDLNGMEIGMPPNPNIEQDGPTNPQYTACLKRLCGNPRCMNAAEASCAAKYPPKPGCVANCGHTKVQYSSSFPMSSLGTKLWDYNTTGVAHYGMLADFLYDVKNVSGGAHVVNDNLMYGADYFLQTWKKCEALKDHSLAAAASPSEVRPNVPTTIVVQVMDAETRTPVPSAVVHVDNKLIPAGKPFQHTFSCHGSGSGPRAIPMLKGNSLPEPVDFRPPAFEVSAAGYLNGTVEFTVSGIKGGSEICK